MPEGKRLFGRLLRETRGQDLIEYALLAAFISLVAYVGAGQLGGAFNDWYASMAFQQKKSQCSAQGMIASGGKCHGG